MNRFSQSLIKRIKKYYYIEPKKLLELGNIEREKYKNHPWGKNVLMPVDDYSDGFDSESICLESIEETSVFGSEYKRRQIKSVTFLDTLQNMPESAFDVSATFDKSVMAWVVEAEERKLKNGSSMKMYHLFIAADGGINGGLACSYLFAGYCCVERIDFNGCFHTDGAVLMNNMFSDCYHLTELDLSSFNVGLLENTNAMFECCQELSAVNFGDFLAPALEYTNSMFFGCEKLINVVTANEKVIREYEKRENSLIKLNKIFEEVRKGVLWIELALENLYKKIPEPGPRLKIFTVDLKIEKLSNAKPREIPKRVSEQIDNMIDNMIDNIIDIKFNTLETDIFNCWIKDHSVPEYLRSKRIVYVPKNPSANNKLRIMDNNSDRNYASHKKGKRHRPFR
ncbi:MAG: BspA family leucine-rich repeat surface protein [Ruminococcus sp.]